MSHMKSYRTRTKLQKSEIVGRQFGRGGRTLVAVAALAVAPLANAADNGRIAYVACGPYPVLCDIWTMNADGTDPVNVTNTPDEDEFNPAFSADGSKIAFIRGYNGVNFLWTMNADGTNPFLVTPTSSYQFGPSWSPGGTQIALTRQYPGNTMSIQFDIAIVNADGSGERKLTDSDFDEMEPAWSPDGAKIAFAGVRFEQYPDPVTGAPLQGAQWEIVTVDIDGSSETILTAGAANSDRADFLEEDRAPAWSPDGSQLVFMSQDQVPSCCGPWQIWSVNRDGSGITNVTADTAVNDLFPSWSPDGTQILFQRADGTGGFNLYTMPAPGGTTAAANTTLTAAVTLAASAATPLTSNGNARDPDWQRLNGAAPQFPLTVSVATSGKGAGGTVASDIAGIRCGRDCAESYPAGTIVQLTATPKKGSAFEGWSGACSGISPVCEVTVSDVRWIGATFTRAR